MSGMESEVFRSGRAARWMPRVLGAAALFAGFAAAARIPSLHALLSAMKLVYVAVGAFAALQIVRTGGEVRIVARVEDDRLWIGTDDDQREIEYGRLRRFEYDTPFARSMRRWLPAAVLVDDTGTAWRLPATLERGDALVRRIVERSGDDELRTWAETHRLERRMGRPQRVVRAGYAAAALLFALALVWTLRGSPLA